MAQNTKSHPYHLVNPSPWPLTGALGAMALAAGTVLYAREKIWWVLALGFLITLGTMLFWWRDVVKEAKSEHTPQVRIGFRYGMAMFIASEVMFFVAFFWAYLNASLVPTEAVGHVWPPKGLKVIDPLDLPYLNTVILLLSGTTITWAHHSIVAGDMKDTLQKTMLTILLGVLFLGIQVYEYMHATFPFKGGIYASTFYMATGFHGFHVFVGVCFLAVCWFRTKFGHFTAKDHFGFEAAAWYWHFVDVVWLFLFILIYLWGSLGAPVH